MNMIDKWYMITATRPNLYSGTDLTVERIGKIDITLTPGKYRFIAAITTTDTDGTNNLIRFMTEDEEAANENQGNSGFQYIERSINGEAHFVDFINTLTTDHIYIYAADGYLTGANDTATIQNIQIIPLS